MNEHKTASFVAKAAWLAFLVMALSLFWGGPVAWEEFKWFWVVYGLALAASSICRDTRAKK